MSTRYLLLKLAEEAGEVVVAAIKHRLHRTKATRLRLEQEIGDLYAIVELLCHRDYADDLSRHEIHAAKNRRVEKEHQRMKGKA